MPSALSKKGLSSGLITQKQYDKLPPHLLDAIVKKKMKGPMKAKPMKKKQSAPPRKRPAPRRRVAKAVGGKGAKSNMSGPKGKDKKPKK